MWGVDLECDRDVMWVWMGLWMWCVDLECGQGCGHVV